MYRLEWHSGGTPMTTDTPDSFAVLSDLISGTEYTISVTAVAADNKTQGDSFTVTQFTKPAIIQNLRVTDVTVSSVSLNWSKPVGNCSFYQVYWTDGHINVSDSYVTINNLNAGVKYAISVTAVAGDGHTGGQSVGFSQYTRPEVVSDITALGDSTHMLVSWTPAAGRVDSYTVLLYRDTELVGNSLDLSNTTSNKEFQGLQPGVLYCVMVTTRSGNSESNSSCVYNATFPNPPGPIAVVSQTVHSINFTWPIPEDMNHGLFNFSVSTVNGAFLIKDNWLLLDNLDSGSPYNIIVVSVGAWNYKSTAVRAQHYTRPYSVTNLRQTAITTDAVTLVWEQPQIKPHYSYVVQSSNGSSYSDVVSDKTHTISGLLSGSNYSFTVTTQTADGTQAAPVTVSYLTRPYSVKQLVVDHFNTSTVHLVWMKPLQYKDEYKYRVVRTDCGSQNQTVTQEAALISELTPGTDCTFCVFVIAADGTEAEANCTSQRTYPESVQPSISSQGSNSSVLVSWSKPAGNVDYFKVYLNSSSSALGQQELNSTNTSFLFEGLSAGTLYTARVITFSGPLNASSGFISNATFPNPPGPIEVLMKTTSTIEIRWEEAPLMTGASFFYKLTLSPPQENGSVSTTNTSHIFDSLISGTSYNISVVTVGVMDFESEKVHIYRVTTKPYGVDQLDVERLNTTTARVFWLKPPQYKDEYKYRVQTTGCGSQNTTVTQEEAQISELTPGTECTFCVFVITVNGIEGDGNCVSEHTHPESVQPSISSQGSNSSVLVSWSKPAGNVDYFKVYLNSSSSALGQQVLNSTNTSFLFEGLSAGTLYTARVITLSGPLNASSGFISNATFPNPPGPIEVLMKTTSTIEIRWEEAPLMTSASFFYKLTLGPPQGNGSVSTTNTSHSLTSLTSGTSYNICVVTVGVMDFESEKVHIYRVTTKPYNIQRLWAQTINTTTVRVFWLKPLQYKDEYKYRVQTTGCGSQNQTVTEEEAQISELTPGTECTFCVFVITVNGIEGDGNCFSEHTHPESVQPSICSQGSNSSVLVSWTKPAGNVDYFKVYLNSSSSALGQQVLNSTNTSFLFEGLSAGTLYTARVITFGGPLNASSGFITNATFPNPPGPIEVLMKTTSTIEIRWEEAPLMTGASFFYKLTLSPPQGNGSVSTTNTSHSLTSLTSGTSYNISVVTVGVMDFESEKVHIYRVTTKPYGVDQLDVERLNTTTVRVIWLKPPQYKDEYKYRVQTTGCGSQNQTVTEEEAQISELTPGTECTFCVFVITVNGIEGDGNCVSEHTHPESVQPSICSQGSNSSVLVSWSKPAGNVDYFKVYLNSSSSALGQQELNSTNTSFLFEGLSAGTLYTARVITFSGPLNASSGFITNATFPNPPGPIEVLMKATSTIEIRWEEAPLMTSASFFYKLTLSPPQENGSVSTTNTSHSLTSLTSGTSYNISVVTVGVMDFESEKVHIYRVTTKPYGVDQLDVEHLNTTTARVFWWKPPQYKDEYKYRVQTTGCGSQNQTVTEEEAQISELTPGTECTFCVFVITVNGIEGDGNCVSEHTHPESVQPSISSQGSNSSVLVSWSKPAGNVDYFKVYLNSSSSALGQQVLNSTNTSFLFEGLSAGTLYTARVITLSGPLNASSGFITNATFPNPPGPIEVLMKTTSTIEIRWEEAPLMTGASFFYKLTLSPPQGNGSLSTTKTSHSLTSLTSGTSYNISVVTVGVMSFESEKVHIYRVTTKPYNIQRLWAQTINTTTVRVFWWKPLQYKDEYKYRVQTTGCGSQNQTVTGEEAQISELTPGTECTFCVFVITVNGIEGDGNCVSEHTHPESVQPSISSQGSNSSVLVSWSKPAGNVDYFKVYLNSSSSALGQQGLTSGSSFLFEGLSAGTLYTARVITLSGPLNASSGFITSATFPNPPGSIEVLMKTTSTIEIRWEEAPLMTSASFFYKLTLSSPQGNGSVSTTNTSHIFDSLISGMSYTISVVTVGVMDFESEKVHIYRVTTRSLNVGSLVAQTAHEDNITVKWNKPGDYQGRYHYSLMWQSRGGLKSITTNQTEYTIYDLDPGSRYNYSVTPETLEGTHGVTTWNSSCTDAAPVNNLTCESRNKPKVEILLSWSKPRGENSGFQVTVNNSVTTSSFFNVTVSNLRHNTKYELTIVTLSCGQPSTLVSHDCWTGITDPPIPPNHETMLDVSEKQYNKFSIQINRGLLDNNHGPITHVGVLMTTYPLDNTSNLRAYLGKTYNQWRAEKTKVYLATVTEIKPQLRSGENHLSMEIGDGTVWEGYINGPLDSNGKYQYAIVLFTSLNVQNHLVNDKESLVSVTIFSPVVQLPSNPVHGAGFIGLAVGATLGIFAILFLILLGFIIYWKRLFKKETTDIQFQSMRSKASIAVRIEDYETYFRKQKADSNCGFAEEFEDLKLVGTGQSKTSALTLENKSKNRYNNVLPYDCSRVKLSIIHGSPFDDYINANYMPGFNSRKEFIAAQGPLPATVNEFWRMIWEKNVHTLVMLTRCNEQGRVKCEQYWGPGTKHFENITVTTTSEIPLEDWTIREFDIKNVKTAETRSVRQFHFTAWPDHGVPETTEVLISFRHLVREHMDQYSKHSPTVVHCSAGVGRTGTFIAIDTLLFQIERENTVDIYGIVHELRMHRTLMVQTEDQYVFLNTCAMDIIRSRTGTNVDLIYQNTTAFSIYENIEPRKGHHTNGYYNN